MVGQSWVVYILLLNIDLEKEWIFIYRNVKFRIRAIMSVYQASV